jgi:cytochrome c oxidase assembly protein subunit 15
MHCPGRGAEEFQFLIMTPLIRKDSAMPDKRIVWWLLSGCLLIFLMVVIGGITRLTGSGLSITEWNVIMGIIPPLNAHDWHIAFAKYQLSPQFQKVNSGMILEEFKSIFMWEYIHRLIGRLIGMVFLLPFCWFLFTRRLDKPLLLRLLLLFGLGGLQGFLGWYMVSSGLINNPHVSHYRLAIHLITAFVTFGFVFYTAQDLRYPRASVSNPVLKQITTFILSVLVLQIVYGALVAGLHAGLVYNTFPRMGEHWIASGIFNLTPVWRNLTENMICVQFIHRSMAWLIVLLSIVFLIQLRKAALTHAQGRAATIFIAALFIQFLLGMLTLLYYVPVPLAVLHQSGAFALFTAVLYLRHRLGSSSVPANRSSFPPI